MRISKGAWLMIILIGVLILAYIGAQLQDSNIEAEATAGEYGVNDIFKEEKEEKVENLKVIVHIAGAVENPGVYELDDGKRLWDALLMAGGAAFDADLDRVNLAAVVMDGTKYYIPQKGEDVKAADSESSSKLININTANTDELSALPNIGIVTANSIISYREKNGLFKNKQDIKRVSGIGDKTYDAIADLIIVE